MFKRLIKDENGATVVEYSLILATVSLVAIVVMGTLGQNLSATFNRIASNM